MFHDRFEHWPILDSKLILTEEQTDALLDEIRDRAFALHDQWEAQGIARCPQDDWLVAESEVLHRHGFPDGWHLLGEHRTIVGPPPDRH